MKKAILGISSGFHDSAAALVDYDGRILFASSEERFTRVKGDKVWPIRAIENILKHAEVHGFEISIICYYENPIVRLRWALTNTLMSSKSLHEKLGRIRRLTFKYIELTVNLESLLNQLSLSRSDLFISDHHLSHATSVLAFSRQKSGLFCILDAFGQDCSGIICHLSSSQKLEVLNKLSIHQSVGLFYSAITSLCGFKVLTGEYKLMGLAPYGKPVYLDRLQQVFGSPNIKEFSTRILDPFSLSLASDILQSELAIDSRKPESPINELYLNLAASAQKYLEYLVINILETYLPKLHSSSQRHVFLGGGVALNCKLTSILQDKFSDYTFSICPAAGDSGSSVGACYAYLMEFISKDLQSNDTAYLGFCNDQLPIETYLKTLGFKTKYQRSCRPCDLSQLLLEGKVGAIFTGAAEFGPRALGNRSILASPSDKNAISLINTTIKSREDFRPLAPITTLEIYQDVFAGCSANNLFDYMLTLANIPLDVIALIPSAVHVDGTGRLQVLSATQHPFLHQVITDFYRRTGTPALINTSFNQRGEPIVNSLMDALECFCTTGLDFLCIDSQLLIKSDQNLQTISAFRRKKSFPLD